MARGHVRRRGDAWELRISAGTDPVTNRRRIISRTIRGTKDDADRALTKLLTELDDGAHRGPDATLGRLLDRWWARGAKSWAPATRRGYATYRRCYLDDHKTRRLCDVTPDWLDQLYTGLLDNLSGATVYKVHTMLHDALGDAVRWGWLAWNPADRVDPPKKARKPIVVPNREKLRAGVATVAKVDKDYACLLHVDAVAGLRRAELIGLRWDDIDETAMTIRRTVVEDERGTLVIQEDTKTHRERRVPLDPVTLALLEEHRIRWKDRAALLEVDLEGAYVFPRSAADPHAPMTPGQVGQRWRRWRSKLGLDGVKLHGFRHAMVTHLLDQGVPVHDVAARAGHANANVTLAIYTHPTTEGARRAGDAAGL